MNGLSKKRKEVKKQARAEPKVSWLQSAAAYETLCCSGYTRLSENPEIIAGVNKIADLTSSMTIRLMRNTQNGDVREKNELSRKIDINPNSYMTRKTFISAIVRTLLLEGDGNCIVYPETIRGYIKDLHIVPPSQVTFMPDGYGYETMLYGVPYKPDEVLHFVINPDAEHPWRGTGYKVVLKDVANNLKQAAKTKKAFMSDKWMPSVIVKVDGSPEELRNKESRKKILESFTETTEAGEPWIIPAEQIGIETIKPLSLNDLAIADGIKIDKETVAAVLDIPKFILGIGEFKENEWNNFINTRIRTICNAIEQEMTKKLLLSPELYFEMNPRSLFAYDIEKLANVGANLYTRGIMTGNEVRNWTGQSPKENLDELIILENYIPQGMIGSQKKLLQEGGEENE